jgi:glycosyltransferase involved in cell wall biosynthesis
MAKKKLEEAPETKELGRPSLCLVMIVKNESKVIKRCIDSVKDYIDYWVIVDTGSTDGTQEMIKSIMDGYNIPGELHERPWVDFGHNRTESLQYSKGKADYRLVIDADDVLVVENNSINPFQNLSADSYKVKIRLSSLAYFRTQIVKGDQDWKYVGVLHEYLSGPSDIQVTENFVEGAEMHASVSGHTRDIKGKAKYHNDALIFEKALITTPKEDLPIDLERRYVFYMAQSYRDAGMYERSMEAYQRRVDLGGWAEEVYISKYWIANLKQRMGKSEDEIINSYLQAWEYRPNRIEALYHLIKFLGTQKRYALAFALASVGMKTGPCSDILFVEEEIWRWRMPDEYAVLSFYNGNAKEAYKTTKVLMESQFFNAIPPQDRERIQKNMEFYEQALQNEQNALEEKKMQAV